MIKIVANGVEKKGLSIDGALAQLHQGGVTELCIKDMYIDSTIMQRLASSFKFNPELHVLDFSGCEFTSLRELAPGMQYTPQLQRLILDCCKLDDYGLDDYGLDDESAMYIAQGMKHTPLLQEISFFDHDFGLAGVRHIANGASYTPQLQKIEFGCEPMTPPVCEVVGLIEQKAKQQMEYIKTLIQSLEKQSLAREDHKACIENKTGIAFILGNEKTDALFEKNNISAIPTITNTRDQTIALLRPDAEITVDGQPAGIGTRLLAARELSRDLVADFDAQMEGINKDITQLVAEHSGSEERRQAALQEIEAGKKENKDLDANITNSQLRITYGEKRWKTECKAHINAKMFEKGPGNLVKAGLYTGAAVGAAALIPGFGPIIAAGLLGMAGTEVVDIAGNSVDSAFEARTRNKTYEARMRTEQEYEQEVIKLLESQKVNVSGLEKEISNLAKRLKEIAESKELLALRKDEVAMDRLATAVLVQRVSERGALNCERIERRCLPNHGFDSIDSWLEAIKPENARLHEALSKFVLGHANTADMHVIIEEGNAIDRSSTNVPPAMRVLDDLVEKIIKPDVAHFLSRASMMDVVEDLGLMTPQTEQVTSQSKEMVPFEQKIDAATKFALSGMFADQTGVSHIGNYDMRRLFSFYLHRHGDSELTDTMVEDGRISYDGKNHASKAVSIISPSDAKKFTERFKRAYTYRDEQPPKVSDLFLRICSYEYFLPQIADAAKIEKFSDHPEAPVGIGMANTVVDEFVRRMVGGGIDDYRQKIGENSDKVDAVIAQSFLDFFKDIGMQHKQQFQSERQSLHNAHQHDEGGPAFTDMQESITEEALNHYDDFLKIYARNLEKTLQVLPKKELPDMQRQIEQVKDLAEGGLAPEVNQPGSHTSLVKARRPAQDQRGENMTERYVFNRGDSGNDNFLS